MGEAEKEREKGSHENFILLCYLYSKMGTCDIDKVHAIDTIERKAIDDSDPWVYLAFLIIKYSKKILDRIFSYKRSITHDLQIWNFYIEKILPNLWKF